MCCNMYIFLSCEHYKFAKLCKPLRVQIKQVESLQVDCSDRIIAKKQIARLEGPKRGKTEPWGSAFFARNQPGVFRSAFFGFNKKRCYNTQPVSAHKHTQTHTHTHRVTHKSCVRQFLLDRQSIKTLPRARLTPSKWPGVINLINLAGWA